MKKLVTCLLLACLVLSGCGLNETEQTAAGRKRPSRPRQTTQSSQMTPTTRTEPTQTMPSESEPATEVGGVFWTEHDLVAVVFLGYNQEASLDAFLSGEQVKRFRDFYPDIWPLEALVTDAGDEVYVVVPRFSDSQVMVQDASDQAKTYYQGPAKPLVLQTNKSDLYADTIITVSLSDAEVSFSPQVDGTGLLVLEKDYGVAYLTHDLSQPDPSLLDPYSFEGEWISVYFNDENELVEIRLIFDQFQEYDDEVWCDLRYYHVEYDQELYGTCNFRVPVDFWEPLDEEGDIIYIDLIGPGWSGPHQIVGKFEYLFYGEEILQLRHVSYDPFQPEELFWDYELYKITED